MHLSQRSMFVGLLFGVAASCSAAVPTAEEVLAKARTTATAEHKAIFLRFDASS